MLAQPLIEAALSLIFVKMKTIYNSHIGKRQRDFLTELFRTVFALRGRVNFTNMARFSALHEQTFRRHFARTFDWLSFNLVVLRLRAQPDEPVIGVFDTSFLPKSGKKTWGLDKFFSSTAQAVRTGLEVSLVAVIATVSRRTIALDAVQTPAGLSRQEHTPRYGRLDFYLEQLTDILPSLPQVRYWVGDGSYARRKVFATVTGCAKHLITKLRPDANLRFLVSPWHRQHRGRPRRYAGKVRFADFDAPSSGFDQVGVLEDLPHVRLYTARVNSEHFKRDLRVVVLHNERDESYLVLCSIDVEQSAEEIVLYYRLRYQLEFVIRDAKQHLGLTHCQARDQHKLDFHLNVTLAAVNLGRLVSERVSSSLASLVRESYNAFLVESLFSELSLDAEFGKSHPGVRRVIQLGRLAA